MKQLLSILFICLFITGCATNRDDIQTAGGAPLTDEQIGVKYLLGRGVPRNYDKAFTYFKRAANDNNPFAQNELAYLYFSGKGTPQNYGQAFYWYQKAANANLASAQYNLGLFYLRGIGTQENPDLAKEWLNRSAANGFGPAKKALANI